jgi:hypothetical protein
VISRSPLQSNEVMTMTGVWEQRSIDRRYSRIWRPSYFGQGEVEKQNIRTRQIFIGIQPIEKVNYLLAVRENPEFAIDAVFAKGLAHQPDVGRIILHKG